MELDIRGAFEFADYESEGGGGGGWIDFQILVVLLIYYWSMFEFIIITNGHTLYNKVSMVIKLEINHNKL